MSAKAKTYDFHTQLALGQQAEAFLDRYFARWYQITPATDAEQRQGIDRWFSVGSVRTPVEYKADFKARKTHNAFIETISVDAQTSLRRDKSGWAYTSRADILIYYVLGDDLIYVVEFTALRERLAAWAARYPTKSAPNETYQTWGMVVPLHELERIAKAVFSC